MSQSPCKKLEEGHADDWAFLRPAMETWACENWRRSYGSRWCMQVLGEANRLFASLLDSLKELLPTALVELCLSYTEHQVVLSSNVTVNISATVKHDCYHFSLPGWWRVVNVPVLRRPQQLLKWWHARHLLDRVMGYIDYDIPGFDSRSVESPFRQLHLYMCSETSIHPSRTHASHLGWPELVYDEMDVAEPLPQLLNDNEDLMEWEPCGRRRLRNLHQ